MTKGLSQAITAVQKNLDKPTYELVNILKPFISEIFEAWDELHNCSIYDRMERIGKEQYHDEAPAWESQQWD